MEQDDTALEEGEISDDSEAGESNYVPLERPPNYSAMQPTPRFPRNVVESDSEEEIQSSDSDSDSEPSAKKKRKPRIKLKPAKSTATTRDKKYDIWSTRVQEDFLAETLNSCDVTTKDRSRNVESYDYTVAYKFHNDDKQSVSKPFTDRKRSNKRTMDDRNNAHYRQRRRSSSSEKEKRKGKKRVIVDLAVSLDSSPEDIAKDIGNKLFEEKEDLILKVINTLGKKRAIEIFKDTKKIEEEGGMLVMNQTRRRTPGGVFLYLVRNDYHITPEQKTKIFGEDRKKNSRAAKERQKAMLQKVKFQTEAAKAKLLPDLLNRGDLFMKQNSQHTLKEAPTDENNSAFNNPPPTPETDANDNSNDGLEPLVVPVTQPVPEMEDKRGKLEAYEDDFLDISGSADMDLF